MRRSRKFVRWGPTVTMVVFVFLLFFFVDEGISEAIIGPPAKRFAGMPMMTKRPLDPLMKPSQGSDQKGDKLLSGLRMITEDEASISQPLHV